MNREKPLEGPFSNGYLTATEFTDVATSRGGRTFKLNFIYRFGQLQEEKRSTRNAVRGGNENMDMGY